METYFAIVHKDPDSAYGISFPDLPGCFSAADDAGSIYDRAQEALALYLRDQDTMPKARSIEDLLKDPEVKADVAGGAVLLAVPTIAAVSTKERVNIMLDRSLLAGLDRSARVVGISRSEYVARSLRSTLHHEGGVAVLRSTRGESTSKKVASAAAKTPGGKSASPAAKKVAASALTQSKSKEATSAAVASTAAKMLRNPKASKAEKTVAASALTQKPGKKR